MAYARPVAWIGLVFFAKQMLKMSKNGKYADAMERRINGIMSGNTQLDGKRFFMWNPLEVNPRYREKYLDISMSFLKDRAVVHVHAVLRILCVWLHLWADMRGMRMMM